MRRTLPPLTGRQLLDLKSSISGIPADFEQYQRAIELGIADWGIRETSSPIAYAQCPMPQFRRPPARSACS